MNFEMKWRHKQIANIINTSICVIYWAWEGYTNCFIDGYETGVLTRRLWMHSILVDEIFYSIYYLCNAERQWKWKTHDAAWIIFLDIYSAELLANGY